MYSIINNKISKQNIIISISILLAYFIHENILSKLIDNKNKVYYNQFEINNLVAVSANTGKKYQKQKNIKGGKTL